MHRLRSASLTTCQQTTISVSSLLHFIAAQVKLSNPKGFGTGILYLRQMLHLLCNCSSAGSSWSDLSDVLLQGRQIKHPPSAPLVPLLALLSPNQYNISPCLKVSRCLQQTCLALNETKATHPFDYAFASLLFLTFSDCTAFSDRTSHHSSTSGTIYSNGKLEIRCACLLCYCRPYLALLASVCVVSCSKFSYRLVKMQVALATNIKICLPPSWCMMLKLPYSIELHRQAHK